MDAADGIVILVGALFVPAFLIGLYLSKRPRQEGSQPVVFSPAPPASVEGPLAGPSDRLAAIARAVASEIPGGAPADGGGLRFLHRGLAGRVDFISTLTEIRVDTQGAVRQVVEIVPIGFPLSWLGPRGQDRLRARGSRPEYERIFKSRADEQVLLEIGLPYELRMSPEGVLLRIRSLPPSAPALSYWLACTLRIVDLIPEVEALSRVQVTSVTSRLDDALCQICGSSLASGAVVRCELCRTPHHEDCWTYAGKCSTFGCAGRRFVA